MKDINRKLLDGASRAMNSNYLDMDAFMHAVELVVEDELADSLIRILDICAFYDIDIDRHVRLKMQYNATRRCVISNRGIKIWQK